MTKNLTTLFVFTLLIVSSLTVSLPVEAASKTIIVPNDYSTIASAIGNANAGDTVFIRNGTYEGEKDKTLVIDKSISLIGENRETTLKLYPKYSITWILTTSYLSSEDALQITAKDVTISNLTIEYTGDIRVSNEKVRFIETNLDTASTGTGLVITGSECNLTKNMLDGRVSVHSSSNVVLGNSLYSLGVESGNNNTIESNNLHYLGLIASDNNLISKNNISTDLVSSVINFRDSSFNVLVNNNRP